MPEKKEAAVTHKVAEQPGLFSKKLSGRGSIMLPFKLSGTPLIWVRTSEENRFITDETVDLTYQGIHLYKWHCLELLKYLNSRTA